MIEIIIETEVIKPNSPEQITKLIKEAINESISKSDRSSPNFPVKRVTNHN